MAVTTAEEVAVDLLARTDRLERQLRQGERITDRSLGNMESRGQAFAKRFTGALAGVSVGVLAREFLKFADASKQIDAQLRLATASFGTFGQAQADVQRIAAAARNGLTETASLYGNLLRATKSLGGTQADASRATETFSKALKIGGADANSAASATLQFGQALASGVLRGDEFNSIAEASPRILKLLADSLGLPAGQLRALAAEGKLTSDVLFRALTDRKFTSGIDDEFKTLPVTFGDAMQQVHNAATLTFGAFDRGGEFSTALASFVTQGADGFTDLGKSAEQTGIDIRATFAGLTDVFQPLISAGASAFSTIGQQADYARDSIANVLRLYDKIQNADVGFDRLYTRFGRSALGKDTTEANLPQYSNRAGTFEQSHDETRSRGQNKARIRDAASRLEKAGYIVPIRPDGSVDEANIRRAPVRLAPEPRTVDSAKKKGRKGPSAETLAKRAEAARLKELRNDEAFESEKSSLNQDLLRARRATSVAAETVATYELQEIEAARTRQNESYKADVSQKRSTEARANELIALNDAVAAERARAVRLREDERQRADRASVAQSDFATARDIAQVEAGLAETAAERKASALRLLDLEYQMERARLDAIIASRDATDAEREIARRRLAVLGQIEASDRAKAEQENEGPLANCRRRLEKSPGRLREDAEQLVVDELDHVRNGISDAITNRLGVKDPLIAGLLDMFIDQVIMKPLANALSQGGAGASGGGIGGLIASAGSAIGGIFSRGGTPPYGGGRAVGGPVSAGTTYLVGEKGPELLQMGSMSGSITPNHRLAEAINPAIATMANVSAVARPSNVVVVQPIHADFRHARTDEQTMRQFMQYADARSVQARDAAVKMAGEQVPRMFKQFGQRQG